MPQQIGPFRPMYIWPIEYPFYGLPDSSKQPDIDNLVQTVSGSIDAHCCRVDSDGNGSLVYTTYNQRLMNQSPGRNLMLLPMKPLVSLDDATVQDLQSKALDSNYQAGTLQLTVTGNYFYTGALASINTLLDGRSSAIIGASGRQTFDRRDQNPLAAEPYGVTNPLTVITLFGGPAPWIPLDMTNLDYNDKSGEVWYPAGIWLQRYNEVVWNYTSGFNPLAIPSLVKQATASAVKNILGMGGGATGIKRFSGGGVTAEFGDDFLDKTVKRMLEPFVSISSY